MKEKKPETTCHVIPFKHNSVIGKVIAASEGTAVVTFRAEGEISDHDQAGRVSWRAGNALFLEPGAVSWASTLQQFTKHEMYV